MTQLMLNLPEELVRKLDELLPVRAKIGRPTEVDAYRPYTPNAEEFKLANDLTCRWGIKACAQYLYDVAMQRNWSPEFLAPRSRTALIIDLLEEALEARKTKPAPQGECPYPLTTDLNELLNRYAYLKGAGVRKAKGDPWKNGTPPFADPANQRPYQEYLYKKPVFNKVTK